MHEEDELESEPMKPDWDPNLTGWQALGQLMVFFAGIAAFSLVIRWYDPASIKPADDHIVTLPERPMELGGDQ